MDELPHRRRAIVEYFLLESPEGTEVHRAEKVALERVYGHTHDVWDIDSSDGRWWVITNPTNTVARETWDLVSWLTHAANATRADAENAFKATENVPPRSGSASSERRRVSPAFVGRAVRIAWWRSTSAMSTNSCSTRRTSSASPAARPPRAPTLLDRGPVWQEHVAMLRRLLIGLPLAACAFALVGATSTPGAQVRFEIEVSGKGTVRATWGAQARRVECRGSCTRSGTVTTFYVNAGTIVLKAWAARAWTFTGWSRACRGTTPTCALRVQRSTRVKATFVPPGSSHSDRLGPRAPR